MAQKSSPARRPSPKGSDSKLKSNVKSAAALKPGAVAKVPLAKAKTVAKMAASSSVRLNATERTLESSRRAPPPPLPKVEKPARPDQQIVKAKAALKKESATKPPAKARARKVLVDVDSAEGAGSLTAKWLLLNKKADQIDALPST